MPPQPIHAIQRAIRTTLLLTLPSTDRLFRKFQCNNFQESQYRDHFNDWKQACLDIERKAEYRNYPMSFSILSDFSDEDLNRMMNLGVKYSGEGSYADPEDNVPEPWTGTIINRDLCTGAEKYSSSNSNSTSWASALILAAETALKNGGYDEPLSLTYVIECLPLSQEIEPNDVSPSDMITFVTERTDE